ncbi:proliferation marker protein Ki-67 isoform X2 [Bombina bombina]|uniref:proliferation marker protein Ki-67 isoform X2 n=1 Tax=Bombina bombina TaxID=8345 RepID=UPI00235B0280|nr:proliferation marker protein Ki-67 isoform X2 [Bombina bombina]
MPLFGEIVVIKRNGTDGTHFPLTATTCLFGRKAECDIRIQLPHVSKEHCKVEVKPNKEVIVTNLSTVNPVQLNGHAVQQPVRLKHGDVLTIIDRSFRFEEVLSTARRRSSGKGVENQVTVNEKASNKNENKTLVDSKANKSKRRSEGNVTKKTQKRSSLQISPYRRSPKDEKDQSPFSELYQMFKNTANSKQEDKTPVIPSSRSPQSLEKTEANQSEKSPTRRRSINRDRIENVDTTPVNYQELTVNGRNKLNESISDTSISVKSKRVSSRLSGGTPKSLEIKKKAVNDEKRSPKKRKSGELEAVPEPPLKRKRVSFGGHLSPELFDKRLPPNSPLKKGATPARLSLSFIGSPLAVKRKSFGLKQSVIKETNEQTDLSGSNLRKDVATPSKRSPAKRSPAKGSPKTTPSTAFLTPNKMPVSTSSKKSPKTPVKQSPVKTAVTSAKNSSELVSPAKMSPSGKSSPAKITLTPGRRSPATTGKRSPAKSETPASSSANTVTPVKISPSVKVTPNKKPPAATPVKRSPAKHATPGRKSTGAVATPGKRSPAKDDVAEIYSLATPGRSPANIVTPVKPAVTQKENAIATPGRRSSATTSPAKIASPTRSPAKPVTSGKRSPAKPDTPRDKSAVTPSKRSPAKLVASSKKSPAATPGKRSPAKPVTPEKKSPAFRPGKSSPAKLVTPVKRSPGKLVASGTKSPSVASGTKSPSVTPGKRSPAKPLTPEKKSPAVRPSKRSPARLVTPDKRSPGKLVASGMKSPSVTPHKRSPAKPVTPGKRLPAATPSKRSPGKLVASGTKSSSVTPGKRSPAKPLTPEKNSPAVRPGKRASARLVTPDKRSPGKLVASSTKSPPMTPGKRSPAKLVTPGKRSPAKHVTPGKRSPARLVTPDKRSPRKLVASGTKSQSVTPGKRSPAKLVASGTKSPPVTPGKRSPARLVTPDKRSPRKLVASGKKFQSSTPGKSSPAKLVTPGKKTPATPDKRSPAKLVTPEKRSPGKFVTPGKKTPATPGKRSPAKLVTPGKKSPATPGSRSPAKLVTPGKKSPATPGSRSPAKLVTPGKKSPATPGSRSPAKLVTPGKRSPATPGNRSPAKLVTPGKRSPATPGKRSPAKLVTPEKRSPGKLVTPSKKSPIEKTNKRSSGKLVTPGKQSTAETLTLSKKSPITLAKIVTPDKSASTTPGRKTPGNISPAKQAPALTPGRRSLAKKSAVTPANKSSATTPYTKGRFSISHVSTPPVIQTPKRSRKSLSLKTPLRSRKIDQLEMIRSRRKSGATEANLLVAKSWADIVKFGAAKAQKKSEKKSEKRQGRNAKVVKKTKKAKVVQTPVRKVKGVTSTGHADSPATIVIGRAHTTKVNVSGHIPKVVRNHAVKVSINQDESFTGMTELFSTPLSGISTPLSGKQRKSNRLNGHGLGTPDLSVMKTPEESGEMVISPLNNSPVTAKTKQYNQDAVSRLLQTHKSPGSHGENENVLVSKSKEKAREGSGNREKVDKSKTKEKRKTTDLTGIKRMMRTPKQKGKPVTDPVALKKMLRTPKQIESLPVMYTRRFSNGTDLVGIKRIMKTPKQKGKPVEDMTGVKHIMKTPKQKGDPVEDMTGIKRIMRTPKQKGEPVEDMTGIKRIMRTPKQREQPVGDLVGIKRLMRTPREKGQPVDDHMGISQLMSTPTENTHPIEEIFGIKQLIKTPPKKSMVKESLVSSVSHTQEQRKSASKSRKSETSKEMNVHEVEAMQDNTAQPSRRSKTTTNLSQKENHENSREQSLVGTSVNISGNDRVTPTRKRGRPSKGSLSDSVNILKAGEIMKITRSPVSPKKTNISTNIAPIKDTQSGQIDLPVEVPKSMEGNGEMVKSTPLKRRGRPTKYQSEKDASEVQAPKEMNVHKEGHEDKAMQDIIAQPSRRSKTTPTNLSQKENHEGSQEQSLVLTSVNSGNDRTPTRKRGRPSKGSLSDYANILKAGEIMKTTSSPVSPKKINTSTNATPIKNAQSGHIDPPVEVPKTMEGNVEKVKSTPLKRSGRPTKNQSEKATAEVQATENQNVAKSVQQEKKTSRSRSTSQSKSTSKSPQKQNLEESGTTVQNAELQNLLISIIPGTDGPTPIRRGRPSKNILSNVMESALKATENQNVAKSVQQETMITSRSRSTSQSKSTSKSPQKLKESGTTVQNAELQNLTLSVIPDTDKSTPTRRGRPSKKIVATENQNLAKSVQQETIKTSRSRSTSQSKSTSKSPQKLKESGTTVQNAELQNLTLSVIPDTDESIPTRRGRPSKKIVATENQNVAKSVQQETIKTSRSRSTSQSKSTSKSPQKLKESGTTVQNAELQNLTLSVIPDTDESTPTRRGRPSKKIVATENQNVAKSVQQETIKTSRSRSTSQSKSTSKSPQKLKESGTTVQNAELQNLTLSVIPDTDESTPTRRGRPSKKIVATENQNVAKSVQQETIKTSRSRSTSQSKSTSKSPQKLKESGTTVQNAELQNLTLSVIPDTDESTPTRRGRPSKKIVSNVTASALKGSLEQDLYVSDDLSQAKLDEVKTSPGRTNSRKAAQIQRNTKNSKSNRTGQENKIDLFELNLEALPSRTQAVVQKETEKSAPSRRGRPQKNLPPVLPAKEDLPETIPDGLVNEMPTKRRAARHANVELPKDVSHQSKRSVEQAGSEIEDSSSGTKSEKSAGAEIAKKRTMKKGQKSPSKPKGLNASISEAEEPFSDAVENVKQNENVPAIVEVSVKGPRSTRRQRERAPVTVMEAPLKKLRGRQSKNTGNEPVQKQALTPERENPVSQEIVSEVLQPVRRGRLARNVSTAEVINDKSKTEKPSEKAAQDIVALETSIPVIKPQRGKRKNQKEGTEDPVENAETADVPVVAVQEKRSTRGKVTTQGQNLSSEISLDKNLEVTEVVSKRSTRGRALHQVKNMLTEADQAENRTVTEKVESSTRGKKRVLQVENINAEKPARGRSKLQPTDFSLSSIVPVDQELDLFKKSSMVKSVQWHPLLTVQESTVVVKRARRGKNENTISVQNDSIIELSVEKQTVSDRKRGNKKGAETQKHLGHSTTVRNDDGNERETETVKSNVDETPSKRNTGKRNLNSTSVKLSVDVPTESINVNLPNSRRWRRATNKNESQVAVHTEESLSNKNTRTSRSQILVETTDKLTVELSKNSKQISVLKNDQTDETNKSRRGAKRKFAAEDALESETVRKGRNTRNNTLQEEKAEKSPIKKSKTEAATNASEKGKSKSSEAKSVKETATEAVKKTRASTRARK